ALRTKRYLEKTLDVVVEINPLDLASVLPHYFMEHYRFFELLLNAEKYLLFEGRGVLPGNVIKTHSAELERRFGNMTVYLKDAIGQSLRRSLVERRVPFIVPDNQIYLPLLGFSFREQYRQNSIKKDRLSPATQVILIRSLLSGKYDIVTASEYAKQLKYSVMSVSRAFKQLSDFGLVSREENWKERPIRWLFQGRDLWEKAHPFLINPVSRSIWIQALEPLPYCVAGLSALSKYSMINATEYVTYATISSIAKSNDALIEQNLDAYTPGQTCELQIWRYDPKLISLSDCVDPLSLYLSFKDDPDDRIQISLDEMIGGLLSPG
ncbi:MAG: MarR family winged helix-turn-helix transcriptional regulator, partial [Candidatus Cloacimonadaceae bacterium]|nr:MarR family winged helix-turn-helix transcriptional regulator [Candidatus Cloacimonadaceae bacterium]